MAQVTRWFIPSQADGNGPRPRHIGSQLAIASMPEVTPTRAPSSGARPALDVAGYLAQSRELVLAEVARHVPNQKRDCAGLYELMLDYPLRPAKALRPALCFAVCAALGGELRLALPSATALELLHNAFLIHDDIEDGSRLRRHGPSLHLHHGMPIAVNVGDGLFALALEPLLANIEVLGLGRSLQLLRFFSRILRESVEGQMLELAWIRQRRLDLGDRDYLRMVHKKTSFYSFVAPVQIGALAAGADAETQRRLGSFAVCLGVAFQIKDDLISLELAESSTGKDTLGDLWDGKYTLPLLHSLRVLPERERREALELMAAVQRRRGRSTTTPDRRALLARVLEATPDLDAAERALLVEALDPEARTDDDMQRIRRLHDLIAGRDGESLRYARTIAERFAGRAARAIERQWPRFEASVHADFLRELVQFVLRREH